MVSQRSLIVILLCLIASTGRFVMDSYLPSMPAMSHDLWVTQSQIEETLSIYLLGFGFSQLFYGPLSDAYGRRPLLMIGFFMFLIANTLCAFSQSLPILLAARLFSGIGIGATGVLNRAIANDRFSGAEFSKIWSYTTTTLVLVLMLAPLLGSVIQTFLGWRANFIMTTVYVLVVAGIVYLKLPETNEQSIEKNSFQKVMKNYKTILLNGSFLKGALCYTLAFSGLIVYFQGSAFLLMEKLGLSSIAYGYISVVVAICYLSGGFMVRWLAPLLGPTRLLKVGVAFILLSGVLMAITKTVTLVNVLLPICLYVIGARVVIPNAIASAFLELRHLGGSASGMIGFIQMLGSALISFMVTCFNNEFSELLAVLFIMIGIVSVIILYWPEYLWVRKEI